VPQRRQATGCIPARYEMILRSAGVQGIDFDAFQDEFDLDKDLPPDAPGVNHFGSVAAAVNNKYPSVVFRHRGFPKAQGAAKLTFIENQLAARRPILISLALAPFGSLGWHVMPVVDADADTLTLLRAVLPNGQPDKLTIPKAELVQIHDT